MKLLVLAPLLLAGCLSDPAPPGCLGPPQPIAGINTVDYEGGPWLSPDRLELFFTSTRNGGVLRIFHAARGTLQESFEEVTEVPGLPSGILMHPFVESDGLTLWFARIDGMSYSTLWRATRKQRQSITFDPPASVNVGGPIFADGGHPTMTADRLTLIFHALNADTKSRLFRATRSTPASDAWSVEPLESVAGTLAAVYDPSISASGDRLLFSASLDGAAPYSIYESDQLGTGYEPGVLEEDTANPEGPSSSNDDEPMLHSGGETIVFASSRGGGNADVYMACP